MKNTTPISRRHFAPSAHQQSYTPVTLSEAIEALKHVVAAPVKSQQRWSRLEALCATTAPMHVLAALGVLEGAGVQV